MAEAYLRHCLTSNGSIGKRHRVSSGGTLGIVDDPAATASIAVMSQECEIDLSSHRSRGLNREIVEDADVILVMDASHRRYLQTIYPAHVPKVRLLSDFAPRGSGVSRGGDIFDPVGMEPEAFRRCFRLIRACVDGFVESVRE